MEGDDVVANSRRHQNIERLVEVQGEVRTCQCMVGLARASVVPPMWMYRGWTSERG